VAGKSMKNYVESALRDDLAEMPRPILNDGRMEDPVDGQEMSLSLPSETTRPDWGMLGMVRKSAKSCTESALRDDPAETPLPILNAGGMEDSECWTQNVIFATERDHRVGLKNALYG
jgi:hypothetical protein